MIPRSAAIAGYVNAATALAQILTGSEDARTNATLGLANNVAGTIWALSFLPIALALYRATRPQAQVTALAALALGCGALAAGAGLELATASGQLTFDQESVAYLPVFGVLGVWLVMSEGLALLETKWPRTPLAIGIVVGACWFVANLLFGVGGVTPAGQEPTNEASDAGASLIGVAYLVQPFWGLAVGRALRAPRR